MNFDAGYVYQQPTRLSYDLLASFAMSYGMSMDQAYNESKYGLIRFLANHLVMYVSKPDSRSHKEVWPNDWL